TGGPQVVLWNIENGTKVRALDGLSRGGQCVRFFGEDQRGLGSGDGKEVVGWDLVTGEIQFCFTHNHAVDDVGLSSDEQQLLSVCRDKTAFLWDLGTGQEVRRFQFRDRPYRVVPTSASFWIVCCQEQGNISLWDAQPERELCRLEGH